MLLCFPLLSGQHLSHFLLIMVTSLKQRGCVVAVALLGAIIVKAKGLFMDKIDNIYYIKTAAERTAEPTETDNYQFSYGPAKEVSPLIASNLRARIHRKSTSALTPFSSARPAATSTTFGKC